jgi:hypothetical protein
MRNDLGFEGLDPFTQVLAVIIQSGDRLFGRFRNGLVRIDKRHQFAELSYAFRNGDAEFRGLAAHGVCQHRLLLDQQRSSRMQGQDALLLYGLDRYELGIGSGRSFADCCGIGRTFFLPFFTKGLTASAAINLTV